MSTSIDNRVVGMQFDNKNFEKNVGHTISALDRLEAKLGFKGAEKGFASLERASHRVNLGAISKAAEVIQDRFTTMGIVGMSAIDRITNSVISAGHRMISQFTLAPLTQGYQEYELKMGSIQTIMASTGASIGVVNGYLEELNRYSDQTIYSFADMTQNIGKFTNAGVSLDKAVAAIQGISNEAAVSGANANEASRAMYNFSQALSAGYVKLIDWKSIENANMATREFKQELIDTAVQLGTLRKNYKGEYQAKRTSITATKNFNDSLQEQWMTSEVLIETLKKYADSTTAIGKKAFAAAQDIKTFTQLTSTLKEAIGSGWAQVSEIIIGDIEEAKELWTVVNKVISNGIDTVFNGMTGFLRNNLSTEYKKFLHDGPIDSIAEFDEAMAASRAARETDIKLKLKQNQDIINANAELAKYMADYQHWFNADAATRRKEGLHWMEAPKQLPKTEQEIINLTRENVRLNAELEDTAFNVNDVADAMNKYLEGRVNLTEEERKAKGITEEQYKELVKFKAGIDDGTISIVDMVSAWNSMSGREMIFKALGNNLKYLGKHLIPIKEAFSEVFFGKGYDPMWLNKLAAKFYAMSLTLKVNKDRLENFKNGFKALFTAGKSVIKIFKQIKQALSVVFAPTITSMKNFGTGILHVFGNMDWVIDRFNAFADSGKTVDYVIDGLNSAFEKMDEIFDSLIGDLRLIKPIGKLVDEIELLSEAVKVGATTGDWSMLNNILQGYYLAIEDYALKVFNVIRSHSFTELLDLVKDKLKEYYKTISEYLGKFGEAFGNFNDTLKEKHGIDIGKLPVIVVLGMFSYLLFSLIGGLSRVTKSTALFLTNAAKIETSITTLLKSISNWFRSDALIKKAIAFKEAAKGIFILSGATVVLVGAMWLLTKMSWPDIAKSAGVVLGVITVLSLLAQWTAKNGGGKGALSILAVAGALLLLVAAAKILETVDLSALNKETWFGLAGMFIAMGVMFVAMLAVSKYAPDAHTGAFALTAAIVNLYLLLMVMQKMASISFTEKEAQNFVANWAVTILTLGILMAILSRAGAHAAKGGLGILALVASLLLLVPSFYALAAMPKNIVKKATKTILLMAIPLAALMAVTKLAGEHSHKAGIGMLAMAFALIPIAAAIIMLGSMPKEVLIGGVAAVSAIILMFSVLVAATSLVKAGYKTLLGLSLVIAVVGVVIGVLSMLPLKNVVGVGITLAAVIASIAVAIYAISNMPKGKLLQGGLMIGLLILMLAPLSGLLWGLSKLKNADQARKNLAMVGAILFELTILSVIMGAMGKAGPSILIGAGMLALMVGVAELAALVIWHLSIIDHPYTALKNAQTIGLLLAELTVLSVILGALGLLGPAILIGAGMLALMVGVAELAALVIWNLSIITDADIARKNAITVGALLAELTVLSLIMAAVGATGPAAFGGMLAVIAIVGAIAGVLSALAWLDPDGATIDKLIAQVPRLKELVHGIGEIIGSFYAGVSAAVVDGLVYVSEQFKSIVKNIVDAFTPIVDLPDETVPKCAELLAAIGMITGAEGLVALTTVIDALFSTTDDTGNKTSKLREALVGFSDLIKELSESFAGIESSNLYKLKVGAEAGRTLAEMLKAIPRDGGLFSFWIGKREDMSSFADGVKTFIEAIAEVSNTDVDIDVDKMQDIHDAGVLLADMAKAFPNEGGLIGLLVGDQGGTGFNSDKKAFGQQMADFADSMAYISNNIPVLNQKVFQSLKDAGTKLAELGDIIPNDGGLWGMIVGNNDSETFGKQFKSFAHSLMEMACILGNGKITETTFDSLYPASEDLTKVSDLIQPVKVSNLDDFTVAMGKYIHWIRYVNHDFQELGLSDTTFDILVSMSEDLAAVGNILSPVDSDKFDSFTETIKDYLDWVDDDIDADKIADIDADSSTFDNIYQATSDLAAIARLVTYADVSGFTEFQTAMGGYVDWIGEMSGKTVNSDGVINTVTSAMEAVIKTFTSYNSKFQNAGSKLMSKFKTGISDSKSSVKMAAGTVGGSAVSTISSFADDAEIAGNYFTIGFANGISDKKELSDDAAWEVGHDAVAKLKDGAGEKSPSRFAKIAGKYFVEGFCIGISDMAKYSDKAAYNIGANSVSAISEAIAGVKNVVDHDMEIHPTIRPVVDMTDVETSTRSISAMYNKQQVAAVASGKRKVDNMQFEGTSNSVPGDTNVSFVQNNYSPKALSRIDIYRNTNNQLSLAKGALKPNAK